MAKQPKAPTGPLALITPQDMEDFVESNSDFGFEMQVLNKLNLLGFICSHAGNVPGPDYRQNSTV
jgi:hypothetical protein